MLRPGPPDHVAVDPDREKRLSKLLSFVLRHRPDSIGLSLDEAGWVEVDELLRRAAAHGVPMTRDELAAVVRRSDKQRFALSEGGDRIRASQGHSISVALGYSPAHPPATLYHGTVARFLAAIREGGLRRQKRTHVHLSAKREAAVDVGARRGAPVILEVRAAQMAAAGHLFYLTPNQVWLTEHVPPGYLVFP